MKILLGSISISYDLWLPYSSGCLISYAKHHVACQDILFDEPLYKWLPDDQLLAKLQGVDILGLTCYTWNQDYNYHIASVFKSHNPTGIVIFGGPNVPISKELQLEFVEQFPTVDCFMVGPGERTFAMILQKLTDPVSTWPYCFGNNFNNADQKAPQVSTEFMPQPYLDGTFDSILSRESRIKASFETNRGCPFKCAFCDWGGQANSRVTKFPVDQVNATIDYIYAHTSVSEIEILDANFGMTHRDLDTVKYMLLAKQNSGHNPTVSYSGLVKNGSPYLIDIIDIIHNHLGAEQRHLKLSFQTHSEQTLDVMLRDNIKNQKLLNMLDKLRALNIDISSEMIIGMPGETATSWLKSQAVDYDHGISFMRTYLLSLVCNTKLYERDFRKQHSIKSKKILIPYEIKNVNKSVLIHDPEFAVLYGSEFESSEIIHQCNSFDLDELILMFRYFWWYHNFYNSRAFKKTIAYLHQMGIGIQQQVVEFYRALDRNTVLGQIVARNDTIVSRIFKDEPVTILNDYASYRFFSGSLRTNDLHVMLQNSTRIGDELTAIIQTSHSNLDSIYSVVRSDIDGWIYAGTSDSIQAKKLFNMGSSMT